MCVAMDHKTVFIIVLAWNHLEDTIETLESFLKSDYPNQKIIVVDNASTDDTVGTIKRRYPDIDVIASEKNLGVSGGYNLGIAYAQTEGADYILIANNDIDVDEKMVSRLVEALEADPISAVAMPKIYHYYGEGNRLWCTGGYWRKFPPLVKMSNYNRLEKKAGALPAYIEFAPSCVLLLRGKALEDVGVFETDYFFYFDDWDFSKRVRAAGYKIRFVADATMRHKVSISTQNSEKPYLWWQRLGWSAALYYAKFHTSLEGTTFLLWFIIRECIKGKPKRASAFIKGFRQYRKIEKIHGN